MNHEIVDKCVAAMMRLREHDVGAGWLPAVGSQVYAIVYSCSMVTDSISNSV